MIRRLLLLIIILLSSFASAQDFIMQNATFNQCSAGFFYDSGGEFGPAGNNENLTLTLCPDNPGFQSQVNFTFFQLQANLDFLTIYNGPNATYDEIGTFTAVTNPGLITASLTAINTGGQPNPDGCLTFVYTSNSTGPSAGWAAEISCFEPCQDITANLDSTLPDLEASGDLVIADVNEIITFNGSGTFSSDGTGATYLWDFGDGNTALGPSVTHSYTNAGIYDVTLVITDTNPSGCQSINNIGLIAQVGASVPGNPYVEAGDDISITCPEPVQLSAQFLDLGETNTYTVNEIPFVPPFSFQGLSNSVNTNIDDSWDEPRNLPFDFCFFGNLEQEFQVGSNGIIRFDVDPLDTYNAYNLQNNPLPNNTNEALAEGNVFTPVHDIDPAASSGEEIAWEIIGNAPNRVLAVSFYNVQMYSCSSALATHMAVFYETTNVIDIYVQKAPFCDAFNNNKAIGIQNNAGTEAFVPPGRNTNENGGWTIDVPEAWRFSPAGDSIIVFEWLDENDNVISTDANFEVIPTETTTYKARVTYNTCTGNPVVVEDEITITIDGFELQTELPNNLEVCNGGNPPYSFDLELNTPVVTSSAPTPGDLVVTYHNSQADAENDVGAITGTNNYLGTDGEIIFVRIEYLDSGCNDVYSFSLNLSGQPIINPVSDLERCDDGLNDGIELFNLESQT
ncbi:PKD domain-containing protein, partial [Winogradskyella sp. KYW1333]|uniref:PKD domain-containing protein n=1 Tax=Winogradskyella sp. KYW1333 TaxID=2282123 RepID=UPI0011C03A76